MTPCKYDGLRSLGKYRDTIPDLYATDTRQYISSTLSLQLALSSISISALTLSQDLYVRYSSNIGTGDGECSDDDDEVVDGRKKLVIRERDRVHLEINHPSYGVIVAKVINNVDLYGNENELRIIEILKNDPPQTYPFIIRNYEYKQYEQQTIILMEHANLGNLFDFIKASNNLSYSTIRIIMKQLLLGLNYLHSKGIIHRDIKGQNIMLHSPPGCGIVV
ncbi:MAG: hypothetical protein EZS28_027832 [Streblomastix strix]|uniref:Protein kinase domain-containing protein n=1 Tax=Streblomastix strix TaxID=222440 RepID=A0A5J4V2P6_9EUKA|nr:MAG: hypothetical protein EZS28_027832 [Streblomastix strix]